MPQPTITQSAITKESYLSLAAQVEGNARNPMAMKKNALGEALRVAGELYGQREFVEAYQCLKPTHEKVVTDMQRVLARSPEAAANKLATEQRKPIAAAREAVEKMRLSAKQVIDGFDKLLRDLESKPAVRVFVKQGLSRIGNAPSPDDGRREAVPLANEPPPTVLNSAAETQVDPPLSEIALGNVRYRRMPFVIPTTGAMYSVRDKARGERVIRIVEVSEDGAQVQVEVLEEGQPPKRPIPVAVGSLVRQAEKGWCSFLKKVSGTFVGRDDAEVEGSVVGATKVPDTFSMRLDIQNFGRCCGDIARANIRFDTQLIKDVGDGPFRAGNYEQAFITFEQISSGFNSAVASSRRAIAEGRRTLNDQKMKLSGKEIQERTAAFVRGEQLIHTAEREFSTILEGLRMYLRAQQDSARKSAE